MLALLASILALAMAVLVLLAQRRQSESLRKARDNLQSMVERMDALDRRRGTNPLPTTAKPPAPPNPPKPEAPPNRLVRMGLNGLDIGPP